MASMSGQPVLLKIIHLNGFVVFFGTLSFCLEAKCPPYLSSPDAGQVTFLQTQLRYVLVPLESLPDPLSSG